LSILNEEKHTFPLNKGLNPHVIAKHEPDVLLDNLQCFLILIKVLGFVIRHASEELNVLITLFVIFNA